MHTQHATRTQTHLGSRLARVDVKDATHREANLLALRPIHKNQRVVDDSPDNAVFVLHNLYPEAFERLRVSPEQSLSDLISKGSFFPKRARKITRIARQPAQLDRGGRWG